MSGTASALFATEEGRRLAAADRDGWHRWGPYLSERQWGTVREDYSDDGDAWAYLSHDAARSRAYRWGEDGIAGWSDDRQLLCLSLALWNGRDPILKERMFGLTNGQGNHGEDVKELWWYTDGTPTHSYMRMLYRYPQAAFPYDALIAENGRRRGTGLPEYELADTGVLDGDRFFDVTVEYAKASPDDTLMRVAVVNCGPDEAVLHLLPQLCWRNSWTWSGNAHVPSLAASDDGGVRVSRGHLPDYRFSSLDGGEFLFCDNETNGARLYGLPARGYPKDAFHAFVVHGDLGAVNPARRGTKCAVHARLTLAPGAVMTFRCRLSPAKLPALDRDAFDVCVADRRTEADAFYATVQHDVADADARLVQRQALAGLLWSKQYYHFDVRRWLDGDPAEPPPPPGHAHHRNESWRHLNNADIVSMPDKWEYPWYAAWDLAFHCVTFALIDPAFAKGQLVLLTREWYMHPNGQLPAYEWSFDDANPPVHAWAAWRVYETDRALTGVADRGFLERVFHKLMLNFTWWVNRKDAGGRNLFQGGFLGLDNISLFDRSKPLPEGGTLAQADGTAWMAMYCLDLLRIALELARDNPVYEDIATKFFEHFLAIAEAMTTLGGDEHGVDAGLWDETDGFYYDRLTCADGRHLPLRVRSLVGLIPLCATLVLERETLERFPAFAARALWLLKHRPDLANLVSRIDARGQDGRIMLSLLRRHRTGALLSRMLDPAEFLSDHGIRSLSKAHATPYVFELGGERFSIDYEPGTSTVALFGGNSNWRGPVWLPINYLLIEALREFARFYGPAFDTEYPRGSGERLTLDRVADRLAARVASLFLKDADGRRPVHGTGALATGDLIAFNEYFHGDTGEGLGASHQTGWTALVALLIGRSSHL